eukprot:s1805_g8.t1
MNPLQLQSSGLCRFKVSKSWACWAPGLKMAIAAAVRFHLKESEGLHSSLQPRAEGPEQQAPFSVPLRGHSSVQPQTTESDPNEIEVDGQHASLRPLLEGQETSEHFSVQSLRPDSLRHRNDDDITMKWLDQPRTCPRAKLNALGSVALEQWKRHFLNDHMPARRDCAHCVRAQARSKPHRRVQHPESYTLSVDMSGRLSRGDDQQAKGCKYIMVGCFTYPVTLEGRSLLPVPGQPDPDQDQPLPALDVELDETPDDDAAVLPEDDVDIDADDDSPGEGPDVKAAKTMWSTWHKLVQEAKNVAVKQLTFVEPVLPALSRIHARIRALGLPVCRIHSDRAKEFCSAPVKAWALDRDMVSTMTPGSSYKANGRVEGEMNVVKKSIRTLIAAGAALLTQWPLAARHVGERRLRGQLHQLGWPVNRLLRFGATAYALRKSWQERYAPWRDIREEAGVFSRTTWWSEVVPPAIEDQVLYLPERQEGAPMKRHRKKASLPVLSMFYNIEGERVITERHPDFFEFPFVAPGDSSDSWSLETPDTPSASEEEMSVGGGEKEEVPNIGAGGSYPGTSLEAQPKLHRLQCDAPALRSLHSNVTDYIREEFQHLDATTSDQALWMPTVTEAIINRVALEERLLAIADVEVKENSEFLVTRTISHAEVWRDLDAWGPSVKQEYNQLVHEKGAVRQMTMQQLQQLSQEKGLPIELLPGKTVHTRKAQTGAYRSRAVICGNYATATDQEVYAGCSDCTQVRTALKTAAVKDWSVMGTDVRTAFLNAKRRDESKLVAMSIPSIFKRLGLAGEDDVWLVEMALYGLTTSPRDWSVHRHAVLNKLTWKRLLQNGDEAIGHFERCDDENLWRLVEVNPHGSRWCGLLCVYVDDLLFCGEKDVLCQALKAVESQWSCAEAEWADKTKPLKFCGMEITVDQKGDELHLSQRGYEKEMLDRWQVSHGADYPHFKLNETDFEATEAVDPHVLREAQALAGGLLWLATKTRPDLSYGVSTMTRLITRNPQRALEVGRILLNYIKANPGDLHYFKEFSNGGWGERSQLKAQRSRYSIEVFSDIAYAAGVNHRSVQGIAVFFAGSPIAWQSSQQPFVTHSTAEAELVSYCESLLLGRATEALLCTMWGVALDKKNPFVRTLYGDNMAAIGLASGNTCSSWRTRHLRIRASILKEAMDEDCEVPGGVWHLLH